MSRMPKRPAQALGFIEPMYALGVRELPQGADWLYEIKLDGYRCVAGRDGRSVHLWSRRVNVLTAQFLAIAKTLG